ncbi:malate dehydrogenase [Elizabethkingia argentiflava]|uniref:Malate dehydrogenase n=1 Tax=Elizabethkingia argenteiflava TaxID=2681556 RepID=A0A845PXH5_9FLAO|nr:malate dehydrogenase [Elizabethkingia argenteiflava]NAW51177.1 malate dehydrogenase [Elizabethkingia argenteiflava]
MKVSVVGAGAVGASCAEYIAMKNFATEVVLVDIKEGFAEGKAMDLMQTASLNGFDTKITGITNDYTKTAGSQVAVITSGIPRKPGMTREELIGINAGIVKEVAQNILKHSPEAILIVVSNPMDTMAYLINKVTGLPKNRVIGMGGALDSARFKYRLAEALQSPVSDVDGMVIAAHSDTGMLPLTRFATRKGVPVSTFLDEEQLKNITEATKVGGATLTKLLGTSAWYAPGAAVSVMVQSIVNDQKKLIPCSTLLEGEYSQQDICLGVPCIIGKNGVEHISLLDLNKMEKEKFQSAADAVREVNKDLKF